MHTELFLEKVGDHPRLRTRAGVHHLQLTLRLALGERVKVPIDEEEYLRLCKKYRPQEEGNGERGSLAIGAPGSRRGRGSETTDHGDMEVDESASPTRDEEVEARDDASPAESCPRRNLTEVYPWLGGIRPTTLLQAYEAMHDATIQEAAEIESWLRCKAYQCDEQSAVDAIGMPADVLTLHGL